MALSKKPRMILIDLDGTLVDSVPDLAYCIDETMKRIGREPWGEAKVREWVGNGVERLVKRALSGSLDGEPDETIFADTLPIFMEVYANNVSGRSVLYPGVEAGLLQLKEDGYVVCCVTNKAEQFTVPLLNDMGIAKHFELIVSGDTTPKKKPDPMPLLYAAEKMAISPAESLMVGDSSNDVAAARSAGFDVVCLPYGYNHGKDIRESNPDAVITALDELPKLLAAL